jgi:chromodomain-helicase-DNA-binding protein 7
LREGFLGFLKNSENG